jgi:hypothetical protein
MKRFDCLGSSGGGLGLRGIGNNGSPIETTINSGMLEVLSYQRLAPLAIPTRQSL